MSIEKKEPRTDVASDLPLKFPVTQNESLLLLGLLVAAGAAEVNVTKAPRPPNMPDLSPNMERALLLIARNQEQVLPLTKLANALGSSVGWASRIVDDLTDAGYLTRAKHRDDRRVALLVLTAAGSALVEQLKDYRTEPMVATLSETSPEHRYAIRRFLENLTVNLRVRLRKLR